MAQGTRQTGAVPPATETYLEFVRTYALIRDPMKANGTG